MSSPLHPSWNLASGNFVDLPRDRETRSNNFPSFHVLSYLLCQHTHLGRAAGLIDYESGKSDADLA